MGRKRRFFIFGAGIFLVLFCLTFALAEEVAVQETPIVAQEAPMVVTEAPVAPAAAQEELETQWLWGEVVSVDLANKEITVKYLDYETDSEKEIKVASDDKTMYENAASLEEIKAVDTVSIDYIAQAEGKNIAKNISVEKPEETGISPDEIKAQETPVSEEQLNQ